MNPLVLLFAAIALNNRRRAAASSPRRPSSAPSSAPSTSTSTNGAAPAETLKAGGLYRFSGTLSSDAPKSEAVKSLLRLVAGSDVRIGKREPRSVAFTVRLPMDVPFSPGSVHPQAPWLTLESAAPVEARSRKKT